MTHPTRRILAALGLAAALAATTVPQASAGTQLPVGWNFLGQAAKAALKPAVPPPGANVPGCVPSPDHPNPVVLVHGTFANMADNWQTAAPLLANHGYCVYTFNFGAAKDTALVQGTGDIAASAATLSAFVDKVLAETGAAKVDLVGHSQGGMMPRYYLKNLGGAAKVDKMIGIAPSNHGTTLYGLDKLATLFGLDNATAAICPACAEQIAGSTFLTDLNAGGETMPGVTYTVIESTRDEIVTPYTSAFLTGTNVTNITLNAQCADDKAEHVEIAADPRAMAFMLNALDPAHPVTVPCIPVRPFIGPAGPVPAF